MKFNFSHTQIRLSPNKTYEFLVEVSCDNPIFWDQRFIVSVIAERISDSWFIVDGENDNKPLRARNIRSILKRKGEEFYSEFINSTNIPEEYLG